jgi:hypothetical protein
MKTSVLPEHVRVTMERAIAEQMDLVEAAMSGMATEQHMLLFVNLIPRRNQTFNNITQYAEYMRKYITQRAKKEAKEGRWDGIEEE